MPFVSQAQRAYMHIHHPKIAEEFERATPKGAKLPQHVKKSKKKYKIVVNNKMRDAMGNVNIDREGKSSDGKPIKIQINMRAHKKKGKLDKAELASTVKHELLHIEEPKLTEKEVASRTAKTKIPPAEQAELLKKLHRTTLAGREGALRKKYKMKPGEKVEPGAIFNKAKEVSQKTAQNEDKMPLKKRVAFMGLI